MENKIKFTKDVFDNYEPSDSEDDYDEEDRKLLKEVRKRRPKDDSKMEVFGFDEKDESDDDEGNGDADDDEDDGPIENSDFDEDGDNELADGIPDSKAWGQKRSAYYNTDFVDQDYSTYNEQEEEQALQEEEEAKAIQQRLAKQLNDADFSLDFFAQPNDESKSTADQPEKLSGGSILKKDLSDLSTREKLQIFEKESPEFKSLVSDFDVYMTDLQNYLNPVVEYAGEHNLQHPLVDFVKIRHDLILTYSTNISFYLLLKTKRIPVKNHPVIKRLVQFRQLLQQTDERYHEIIKPELEKLLTKIKNGEEILLETKEDKKTKKLKSKKKVSFLKTSEKAKQELPEDESMDGEVSSVEEEDGEAGNAVGKSDGEEGDERRAITYQIAKNKGLTPHRKKENRNPRVKHRNKYRKAIIRRKGAVRKVRKEIQRYGGEISGIKATVKKGIKIKS